MPHEIVNKPHGVITVGNCGEPDDHGLAGGCGAQEGSSFMGLAHGRVPWRLAGTGEKPRAGAGLSRQSLKHIVLILAGLLCVSALHHAIPHSAHLWHNVFQWLYYLPVVFAATHFGLRGGLATAVLAAVGYIPHFLAADGSPDELGVQSAEVVVLFLVSIVTGVLADRERRRREELQKTTDELNRVHQELQVSFEQLRSADRLSAVGQLAASLAHEIRTPLASIRGAVDVIEKPQVPEELREEFRGILKKECSRLEYLLTNLLDFARARRPQYLQVDIGRTLDSVIALVAHAADGDGIKLHRDVPPDTPPVECDPVQLKQVILNLALNALQAMTEPGEILITAHQQGAHMLIQVSDEGPGISSEQLDKIFDPFFTTKENGTGLGLSIAHQIVTQHGGTIAVDRNAGKGMTFSVILPLGRRRTA